MCANILRARIWPLIQIQDLFQFRYLRIQHELGAEDLKWFGCRKLMDLGSLFRRYSRIFLDFFSQPCDSRVTKCMTQTPCKGRSIRPQINRTQEMGAASHPHCKMTWVVFSTAHLAQATPRLAARIARETRLFARVVFPHQWSSVWGPRGGMLQKEDREHEDEIEGFFYAKAWHTSLWFPLSIPFDGDRAIQ